MVITAGDGRKVPEWAPEVLRAVEAQRPQRRQERLHRAGASPAGLRPRQALIAAAMRRNRLKELAEAGAPILNAWLAIPSAYSAEVMGHQGFDSVTVDLQHGMIGFDAAVAMLQAISSTPAVPIARVSKNDYALVMQLLDAGAYGIICPMISTPEEAEAVRLLLPLPADAGSARSAPPAACSTAAPITSSAANDEILALAMLETREAVAQADAILDTPGLDGIYIGPNDLCLAYGRPPAPETDDPEVAGIIADLARRARGRGRIAGIFCSGGEGARQRSETDSPW